MRFWGVLLDKDDHKVLLAGGLLIQALPGADDAAFREVGEECHGIAFCDHYACTRAILVVQLVRTPACHAGGRRFEPVLGRHIAPVAQLVEQRTENPRVGGSIPPGGTMCGCSSSGRAPPCQGGGSEFEPRHPLH